jgi:molybdopterin-containing oxidoreductase family iron-sulfur binding subunit
VQPGLADNVVVLSLGYGRDKTGRIGNLADGTPAGVNAYRLKGGVGHLVSGARIALLAGVTRQMASTQEHGSMEGRPLVREINKDDFEKHPNFTRNMDLDGVEHTAHIPNDAQGRPKAIYNRPKLDGMHQWGMVLDLTTCVGCTACTVACQSENNIPIVGKEQVTKGREMSWIRIDRYFAGSMYDPQIAYQPVFCLHCENAPCESVCPVNATVHDDEGLNLMTYNRCVGTRYCSNNCPYKVRRFNFFDYNRRPINDLYKSPFGLNADGSWELARWFKDPDKGTVSPDQWDLLKLARNPDVTVRMRGVMEKCTYCIQRIAQAKIAKKVKARASGEVRLTEPDIPKAACQQACPADAIVFGDISDPTSQVAQARKLQHNYEMLGWLDTRPRTTYLARLRNPNPKMPDYYENPAALEDYIKHHGSPLEPHGGHVPTGHAAGHATATKGAH